MMRNWLATVRFGSRDAGHICYALTPDKPRVKARHTGMSLPDRCELDDDAEIAALVNVRAPAINKNTKAYRAGYADGAATAREEGAEFALSAQQAGRADEALLNAVGLVQMARILGVTKPLDSRAPMKTTLEFRSARDEYNAGYAAGWDAAEVAVLERVAQL